MVLGNEKNKSGKPTPKGPKTGNKKSSQKKGDNNTKTRSQQKARFNLKGNNAGGRISRKSEDKVPDGNKALQLNEKKVERLVKRDYDRDISNLAAAVLNASVGERTEDLYCMVNPHIIAQYLWGVMMAPLAASTNFEDLQNCLKAWLYLISEFHQMPSNLVSRPLPKAAVELRAALEPRRIKRYNYIPDWTKFAEWVGQIEANGLLGSNWGIPYAYPLTTQTTGFVSTQSTIPTMFDQEFDKHIAKFASFYKPINYDKWMDNAKDASAFSFDIAGPAKDSGVPAGNTMAFHAGFDTTNSLVFLRQSGFAGLEVKIRRQHLAMLRVCTSALKFWTGSTTQPVNNVRRAINSIRCDTTPSVLGWNSSARVAGRVQLKAVPGNSVGRDVRMKLEALAQVRDTTAANTIYANWIGSAVGFDNKEIRILCAALVKSFSVQYSGAYFGTVLLNSNAGTTTINFPMKNEYHAYTALLSQIRLPEMLLRCLGAQNPFMGSYSMIIPWRGAIDPAQLSSNIIADGTYAGITNPPGAQFIIPTAEEQWSLFTRWQYIINKYKPFEMAFETRAVMAYRSKLGPTMLDMTCVQNVSNFGFMSVAAQRDLDQTDINLFFSCPGYLTYDYTDQNTYQNREYGQFNRYDCGGLDLPGTLQQSNVYDGIVLGGQTYNISDGSGTNHSSGASTTYTGQGGSVDRAEVKTAGPKLLTAYPHTMEAQPLPPPGIKDRINAFISPAWGNYCGAGWTAGQKALNVNPKMEGGKYLVEPVNEEDAACAKHDAGYTYARLFNRPELKDEADKQFVSDLDKLNEEGKLSMWGKVAAIFFRKQSGHKDDL